MVCWQRSCVELAENPANEFAWIFRASSTQSGNKIVLQRRLKQPGMRWNVKTAQSVVTLRAKAESRLWDSHVVNLICS